MKELEDEISNLSKKKGAGKGAVPITGSGKKGSPDRGNYEDSTTAKANEDLINFLEHKLEEIEKKLTSTQNEYEILQNDYVELQEKMN